MTFDLITNISREKLMADAYSDFLSSVGENYTKLIQFTSKVVADDFDESIDELLEQYKIVKHSIVSEIESAATAQGININVMDQSSDEYKTAIYNIVNSSNVIKSLITQNFDSSAEIIGHPAEYFCELTPGDVDEVAELADDRIPISQTPSLKTYFLPINDALDARTTAIIADSQFAATTSITLGVGYTNMRSLVKSLLADQLNEGADRGLKIRLTDAEGNAITYGHNRLYSLNSLTMELSDNLSSVVASAAAFKASALSSVSDRIATFTSLVSSKVSDAYASCSNFISMLKTKLTTSIASVKEFAGWFSNMTGWDKVFSEQSDLEGYTDLESAYSQMTGENPVPACDFSKASSVIAATAKTVAVSVAAFFKSLWNKITSWADKQHDKIVTTLQSPYDIVPISTDSNSGLVDMFEIVYDDVITAPVTSSDAAYTAVITAMKEREGQWIKTDTIFGEVLMQMKDIAEGNPTTAHLTVRIKPRPVNAASIKYMLVNDSDLTPYRAVRGYTIDNDHGVYGTNYHRSSDGSVRAYDFGFFATSAGYSGVTPSIENVVPFLSKLAEKLQSMPDLYLSVNFTEETLYSGYTLSLMLLQTYFAFGNYQALISTPDTWVSPALALYFSLLLTNSRRNWDFMQLSTPSTNTSVVANIDWLQLLSGTVSSDLTTTWLMPTALYNTSATNFTLTRNASNGVDFAKFVYYLFIWQAIDKLYNPTTYAFLPYLNNTTGFSDPQYHLSTDAENQGYATSMLTKIASIAIVLTVAAVVGVSFKAYKLSKQARLMTYVGKIDAASWDGVKPSISQMWKYNRKQRKLSKLNAISANMANPSSIVSGLLDSPYVAQSFGNSTGTQVGVYDPYEASLPVTAASSVEQRLDGLLNSQTANIKGSNAVDLTNIEKLIR